ncbi:uncharacterized protein N7498_003084 [Penicillium cinerascens]|uniref:Major facilitator superfamily (MFS) profile domain-containing protein n=1 Tax=Penicillium cinerascens TaxID=70096 RepID=A0A9W9N1H2_9EURO|nr:uncharacterized protein N7498_003084 [Penicillium cinerascens]KAJ5211438.1 hypothetical protein N7498_003084 [Penicillium cinerascens]
MSPLRTRFESRLQGKLLVNLITVVCSVAFSLFGYDQGVMPNLIGTNNHFGKTFNHSDAGLQGTIMTVYELTAFIGSITVIFVGDWLGQRGTQLWHLHALPGVIIQCSSRPGETAVYLANKRSPTLTVPSLGVSWWPVTYADYGSTVYCHRKGNPVGTAEEVLCEVQIYQILWTAQYSVAPVFLGVINLAKSFISLMMLERFATC